MIKNNNNKLKQTDKQILMIGMSPCNLLSLLGWWIVEPIVSPFLDIKFPTRYNAMLLLVNTLNQEENEEPFGKDDHKTASNTRLLNKEFFPVPTNWNQTNCIGGRDRY